MQYIQESCDFCDDYGVCSGTPCPYHPPLDGEVKEYEEALKQGFCWGDMLFDEEMVRLSKRTEVEVKADEAKAAAADKAGEDRLRSYVLDKTRKFHCEKVGGKWVLKHKFSAKCRDFTLPGGCWAHEESICRFIHPGEEKLFDFKGQKVLKLMNGAPPSPGLTPRSFSPSNVVFYSPRSTSTSPRNVVTPSKETDCW